MEGTKSEDRVTGIKGRKSKDKMKAKGEEEKEDEEDKVVETAKVRVKRAPRIPSAA